MSNLASQAQSCPNCAWPDPGPYCSECGQRQGSLVPTLGEWISDLMDELFLVNGRVPASLRLLIWPPGRITTEWVVGRRARYLHPFRLYLLVAAVYFILTPLLGGGSTVDGAATGAAAAILEGRPGVQLVVTNALAWWPRIVVVLMVPVLAGVHWASAGRRDRSLVEHAVFSLHVHSVALILMAVAHVVGYGISMLWRPEYAEWLPLITYSWGPVYFVLALRRHYRLSGFRTAWVSSVAGIAYFFAMMVALGALVGLSRGTA